MAQLAVSDQVLGGPIWYCVSHNGVEVWHGHWPAPFFEVVRTCMGEHYVCELGSILEILELVKTLHIPVSGCDDQMLQLEIAATGQQNTPRLV